VQSYVGTLGLVTLFVTLTFESDAALACSVEAKLTFPGPSVKAALLVRDEVKSDELCASQTTLSMDIVSTREAS